MSSSFTNEGSIRRAQNSIDEAVKAQETFMEQLPVLQNSFSAIGEAIAKLEKYQKDCSFPNN